MQLACNLKWLLRGVEGVVHSASGELVHHNYSMQKRLNAITGEHLFSWAEGGCCANVTHVLLSHKGRGVETEDELVEFIGYECYFGLKVMQSYFTPRVIWK